MNYIEDGRLKIVEQIKHTKKEKTESPVLKEGTIVYCRGIEGVRSFYGIVYGKGVLDLKDGSDVYIRTDKCVHLGDRISYWTIEKVVKAKLIIEDVILEEK